MLSYSLINSMKLQSNASSNPICKPYIFSKQKQYNIPKTTSRHSQILALVYTNLKGPLPVQTLEGYKYWQVFVDNASRTLVAAFLKKDEAFTSFKQYKAYAKNKTEKKILVERDDKGREFIGKEFFEFCANEDILCQHTEPDEPDQNGVAERANEDIARAATALLVQAKLPPSFSALAIATYIHTRNCTPTSVLDSNTPYLLQKGKKPDNSYFHIFSCLAYILVPKEKRKALQPYLLGYDGKP